MVVIGDVDGDAGSAAATRRRHVAHADGEVAQATQDDALVSIILDYFRLSFLLGLRLR